MFQRLNRVLPLPYPHFMAFAPLDVWVRMLLRGRPGGRGGAWKRIKPRYIPRIAGGLFTSALGTVLTLPERIAVGAVMRLTWRASQPVTTAPPAAASGGARSVQVLCILGYFRSGTTHLHYLLSCDPRHCTPKWYQVLAPQGFIVSWAFLRWFLVPFLASTRPQDDVAIGPEWPAEDDFALCNWSLSSSMPGRMVVPGEWEGQRREATGESHGAKTGWKVMHNLDGASPRDVATWRYHVWAFAWKIAQLGGRGKVVVLKNPSHTGRIRELVCAFGLANIKFIHLSREPGAVLRSNIAMHRRFDPYLLQPHPGDDEIRRRIIEEYDATERKFLAEAADLPRGTLARLRYQDLIADPIGELRRVYSDLNLPWSSELESRLNTYLVTVRDYRGADEKARGQRRESSVPTESPALPAELAWMNVAFGHDRPAVPKVELRSEAKAHGPEARATTLLIAALLWAAAWLGIARLFNDRLDWLTWPTGVMLGTLALRTAGRGSVKLGLAAAALTLATLLIVAYPATAIVFYRDRAPMPFDHVWHSTRDGLLALNNMVWLFLGIVSAYRLASRKQLASPGAA